MLKIRPALWVSLLIALAGLAVSVFTYIYTRDQNNTRLDDVFQRQTQWVGQQLKNRMSLYGYSLKGLRGYVAGAGYQHLSRSSLRQYSYSQQFNQDFPGARGVGFILRVKPEQESAFIREERETGYPAFRIKQLSPHAGERYVIEYIEPIERNLSALGLDIASEPLRRDAALRAMRTGTAQLTAPITLLQASGKPSQGFLLLEPVVEGKVLWFSPGSREAATVGWVYSPLVVDEVMADIALDVSRFALRLRDVTVPGQPAVFYEMGNPRSTEEFMPGLRSTLDVYGRQWQLELLAKPAFLKGLELPNPMALASEVFLAALGVALLVYFIFATLEARLAGMTERARLAAIVDGAQDAIITLDMEGRITSWNKAAQQMLGYMTSEVLGQPALPLLTPVEARETEEALYARLQKGDVTAPIETLQRRKDGSLLPVSLSVSAVHKGNGKIVSYARILRDISAQKDAQTELQHLNESLSLQVIERTHELQNRNLALSQASQRLNEVFEAAPYGMVVVNQSGIIELVNAQTERLFGWSAEALIGKSIDMLLPTHMRPGHAGHVAGYMQTPKSRPMGSGRDLLALRRNGSEFPVEVALQPFRLNDQPAVLAAISDISIRKLQEKYLAQLSAMHTAILSNAAYAIIATGTEGTISVFNPAAEALLGYSADEMVGKQNPAVFHDLSEIVARAESLTKELGTKIEPGFDVFVEKSRRGLPNESEWTYIHKDGHRIPVLLNVSTLRGKNDQILGYLGIAMDISQQKQAALAMQGAIVAAEAASRAKSAFVANMSHEIRTPLNAILGMMQLLQQTSLSVRQQDYVGKTESAARTLLGILNDILDFSKVEAGKLQLDVRPFDLLSMLEDVAAIASPNLASKPVELLFDLQAELPAVVVGDDLRLRQVLINLTGNAIKFTEQGQIVLRVSAAMLDEKTVELQFCVKDSGIGIAPDKLRHIFESFSQAEASTTRRFGGTGLGLAISQRLVQLMGGTIAVESQPGVGSQFAFSIRCPVQEATAALPLLPCVPDLRLLIIDDNAVARDILAGLLTRLGWQSVVASTLLQARAILQADTRNAMFQAILVDSALALEYRDTWPAPLMGDRPVSLPPLIALHSGAGADVVLKEMHGFAALLHKPVLLRSLNQAVELAIQANGAETAVDEGVKPGLQQLSGLCLLLVEDNQVNQQVASELLSHEGAEVDVANDGKEGLNRLSGGKHYDLVLMDIQMPGMDGYTATRLIRQNPQWANLPIVAMTANAMASDRAACLKAGMNDHIGKPFNLPELIALIRRLTGRAPNESMEAPVAEPVVVPAMQGETASLNAAEALSRFAGNTAIYLLALEGFAKDVISAPETLRHNLAEHDQEAAVRQLHTLKGLAGTVGAGPLADLAREGEHLARTDLATLTQDWLASLIAEILRTVEAAKSLITQLGGTEVLPAGNDYDKPALIDGLKNLVLSLEAANMNAMSKFVSLNEQYASYWPEDFALISQAISQLDFATGLGHCQRLLAELEG